MVNGSADQCTLSHDFGSESAKITFGLRPGLLGESFQIILLTPRKHGSASGGTATITLSPNQQRQMTVPYQQRTLNGAQSAVSMKGYGGADWYFAGTTRIRIELAGQLIDVAPLRIDQALAALRKCHDDLLTSWGVTPAEREFSGPVEAKDKEYAIGDAGNWIGFSDYPSAALASSQQGTVTILWAIGTDGRVHDCRIVSSSGVPSLDAAACTAVTKRGRYRPVLDKAGKPMILHASREVKWSIP